MNKQPFYHDIQVQFLGVHEKQSEEFENFINDVVIDKLCPYVKEKLADDSNIEFLPDTIEVVGDSSQLQVLFTSTNGYVVKDIHVDVEKFLRDEFNDYDYGHIGFVIFMDQPEAGDPSDLM